MAASTAGSTVHEIARTHPVSISRVSGRRYITSENGHALEILGHAIEYLTDEYVREATQLSGHDPQVEAIQLLMALNREIYYDCPIIPTFTERLRTFFQVARR